MTLNAMYFSPTKCSRRIVEGVCKGIAAIDKTYDITLPKRRNNPPSFTSEDVLVVGLPVYAGRIPKITDTYLKELKGEDTPVVLLAVYGNRDYDDALLEMKDIFKERGFIPFAAGAFIGEHSYTDKLAKSRPDTNDIELAIDFGNRVKRIIESDSLEELTLDVKGNFPYRERKKTLPLGPTVENTCIKCGMCVINCPTDALKLDGIIKVNDELCIRCHACVKICPIEAIGFDARIAAVVNWLEQNFMERKEPELFYGK